MILEGSDLVQVTTGALAGCVAERFGALTEANWHVVSQRRAT